MAPYSIRPVQTDLWSRQEQTSYLSMELLCSRAGSAILANRGAKCEILSRAAGGRPRPGPGPGGLAGGGRLALRVLGVVADDGLGQGAGVVLEQPPAAGG